MLFLRLLPAALSLLALAAHFLRGNHLVAAGLVVGCLALLTVPRRWAGRTLMVVLLLAVPIWILQAWVLAQARIERGEPWGRMAAILGGVAALALVAASLLAGGRARAWFSPAAAADR
ncbi:MAG: hypothetical protein D6702_00555 [Planctomycetota bacterium]|nr:MAG: hypothetical protein D6702_00555 [Planctomycetota bacterium]